MGKLLNTLKQRVIERAALADSRLNGCAPADQGEKLVEEVLETPVAPLCIRLDGEPDNAEKPETETVCVPRQCGPDFTDPALPGLVVSEVLSVWPWNSAEMPDIPFIEVPEPPGTAKAPAITTAAAEPQAISANVTFLARQHLTPKLREAVSPKLVVWRQPNGDLADQYHRAKEGFLTGAEAAEAKAVLMVPLDENPDHAATVVNLGLALAEGNARRILLIDTDAEYGHLAALLGRAPSPGWTEWLAGMPVAQIIQDSGWPGVHLIAAGNCLVGSEPALTQERARSLSEQVHDKYDLILFYTSCGLSPITSVLAAVADAICVVMTQSQAGSAAADECIRGLQKKGGRVLGTLMVGAGTI